MRLLDLIDNEIRLTRIRLRDFGILVDGVDPLNLPNWHTKDLLKLTHS